MILFTEIEKKWLKYTYIWLHKGGQRQSKDKEQRRGAHTTFPQIDLKGMAANRKGKRTTNNIGTNYIYLQKRTELCLSFRQYIVH